LFSFITKTIVYYRSDSAPTSKLFSQMIWSCL